MGWSFSTNPAFSKKDQILENQSHYAGDGRKIIDQAVVGNNHWILVESPVNGRYIVLLRMASGGKSGRGWGCKSITEGAFPYYFDCPLRLFEWDSDGPMANLEWRAAVRQFHAEAAERRKDAKRDLTGLQFALNGVIYTVYEKIPGRASWHVQTASGRRYNISTKSLLESLKSDETKSLLTELAA